MRYRTLRAPQTELRERIRALASQHVRWGYRMIHSLLVREGWAVNRKRVQRMYREEGLAVRRKGKRRRSQRPRLERQPLGTVKKKKKKKKRAVEHGLRVRHFEFRPSVPVSDGGGRFSREGLAVHSAYSIPSTGVIQVLERLREERGLPKVLVVDNGPEFTSRAFDAWAYSRGVTIRVHPSRQAGGQLLRGALQRDAAGRVLEPALVPVSRRRPPKHRAVEGRLQLAAAP